MPKLNSVQQLEMEIKKCILQALNKTQMELYEILKSKVEDYYSETPNGGWGSPRYERTNELLNSVEKTNIAQNGNTFSFSVGFSDEYITYEYSGWDKRWGRGSTGKNKVTGENVLSTMFNASMHGNKNFMGSHNYWDEFLDEIESIGGVDQIFIQNCKKSGIPIL